MPAVKPLDEAVWRAWVAKGRAQERRDSAARLRAVEWVSVAALLSAAALWSHVTPFETAIRFIVCAGALCAASEVIHARRYAFAAVFGALVLLYNPIAPVFGFTGGWQQAIVAASTAPFLSSLAANRAGRPARLLA
jgi:hypothetical protein